ncbi:3-(3-hydroxyphenyl)propionate hydroxylase [Alphaproteobacteria bacterium 46_93_T64]|nr:3-(3-hydroxyphenyl)propionate hydroxylase [Alphaproteobacteria bacterium 46_93_T64]
MPTKNKKIPDYDVIIVGLGPVGATLANLLGKCGVRTLVLEKEARAYHLPRAVHFDDEVMRIFQSIGVADAIAEVVRVNVGMRFINKDGALLMDWPRPQEIGPNGWYASYRFHQPDIEEILRHAISRHATVEVKTRTTVLDHSEDTEAVTIKFTENDGCEVQSVTAAYVVGCDGANSIIRQFLGSDMEDLGFQERWLVADVILKRPRPDLGDFTVQYCDPERPSTYARSPGDRRRWEIAVLDHEDAEDICRPATVWQLLSRWISPEDADLERSAVYTFYSKIASRWRKGRLLIAGDAAHLTPPFMGQGMCAGIRDASNLAWKLSLAVKGGSDPSLLDSYQSERSPHTQAYIQTAIHLGGLINSMDSKAALNSAFQQPDGSVRMKSIAPPLGAGLGAGKLDSKRRLFPQFKLTNGMMLDDLIDYRPALLINSLKLPNGAQIAKQLGSSDLRIITSNEEPALLDHLEAYGCSALLLRPDNYIYGLAETEADLRVLLDNVRRETMS